MAQWVGQFSGRTHATLIAELETSLRAAVAHLNDPGESLSYVLRRRAALALGRRLLAARVRDLRAKLKAAETSLMRGRATEDVTALRTRLQRAQSNTVDSLLLEFGWQDAEHQQIPQTESAPYIYCRSVAYRQGFLQVSSGIHPRLVNMEACNIAPEIELDPASLGQLPDEAYVGNVELELTPAEAKELASALIAAAEQAERSDEP